MAAPKAAVCAFHPLWRSVRSSGHNKHAALHESRRFTSASQLAEIKPSPPDHLHAAFISQNNKAINHNGGQKNRIKPNQAWISLNRKSAFFSFLTLDKLLSRLELVAFNGVVKNEPQPFPSPRCLEWLRAWSQRTGTGSGRDSVQ